MDIEKGIKMWSHILKEHEGVWPDIRDCFKHAERNGLRDQCKAQNPVTGEYLKDQWYEEKCLRWARNRGKLIGAGNSVAVLTQAFHGMCR